MNQYIIRSTASVNAYELDSVPETLAGPPLKSSASYLPIARDIDALLAEEENHAYRHSQFVRDLIIGLADGLTVPFALAAGLAGIQNSNLVVAAGFAEIFAGSISMGMGGFLAGRNDVEQYRAERRKLLNRLRADPALPRVEAVKAFAAYGLKEGHLEPALAQLQSDPDAAVRFVLHFGLGLEEPDPRQSWISGATIGISYFVGGLIPLVPYMLMVDTQRALFYSLGFTLFTLALFGYYKSRYMGMEQPWGQALQMMLLGGAAALVSYMVAKYSMVELEEHRP